MNKRLIIAKVFGLLIVLVIFSCINFAPVQADETSSNTSQNTDLSTNVSNETANSNAPPPNQAPTPNLSSESIQTQVPLSIETNKTGPILIGDVSVQNPTTNSQLQINSDNVDNSKNASVSINQSSSNLSSQVSSIFTQKTKITNLINSLADTGKNKASQNKGNVMISTGPATINHEFINLKINYKPDTIPQINLQDSKVMINSSALSSLNKSNLVKNTVSIDSVVKSATISNNSNPEANSGQNEASFNQGDVTIITAAATTNTDITSDDALSYSGFDNFCCELPDDVSYPCSVNCGVNCDENCTTAPLPTSSGSGAGSGAASSGGGAGGSSGSAGGTTGSSGSTSTGLIGAFGEAALGLATGGTIFPASSGSINLWLTLISFLMFFSGLFLKLHSGRAPNFSLS